MLSAVAYSHALLREVLRPGDWAVDATAGNGHDTHFLTQLAGPAGRVFAFDVQPGAIAATRRLLESRGVPESCYCLISHCHAALKAHLPNGSEERIAAIVFNLGYLPGGDKSIVTRAETTMSAVHDALGLLRPGGLLVLVVYPGHEGGAEELQALKEFASGLSSRHWQVTEYRTLNAQSAPPGVVAIQKAGVKSGHHAQS